MAGTFVWLNEFDGLWYVDAQLWAGGGWHNVYRRLAGGFDTREAAEAEARLWHYEGKINEFVRTGNKSGA